MKQFDKKIILISILICIFTLSGCNIFKSNNSTKNDSDADNTVKQDNSQYNEQKKEVSPSSEIQPVANSKLMIYTVNADSGEIVTATAMIKDSSKITPELIVNAVAESMEDESIKLGIESVTTKGKSVIVSFYSNQPPLTEDCTSIEGSILDAIAQSLMENLDDYNSVIYRVEGKEYKSGNFELGINDAYFNKN